jgi:hypothetical protein
MQPTTPRRRRSPLLRYGPFIAIVVVIVIIAVVVASGGDDSDDDNVTTTPGSDVEVPVQLPNARKAGEEDKYTWQDTCDVEAGVVAIPTLNAAPCVEEFTGDNGGPINERVTGDTIRLGYYIPKADPQQDFLLQRAGAYDTPAKTEAAYKSYAEIYAKMYETYGRKVQLVKIQGTGLQTDDAAARLDAEKAAKEAKVFAVMGGPAQTRAFADTLAANKVLCIGTCVLAAPQRFYQERSPYIWPNGPSPEQSSEMLAEFIQKQLLDKNAEFAGDESFKNKKRTFALLSYDTPDGQYTASWEIMKRILKDAGVELVTHKSYFLDIQRIPQVARDVAVALKEANATTVIFTGDPIMPSYFTAQSTDQGYFPEWLMAGTVLADTSVFGRTFDQRQWAHAFGLQLTPARVNQDENIAYTLNQWYHGTPPPSENNYAVVWGNVALAFAGIQTAGPRLTPETFKAGMYAIAPPDDPNGMIDTLTTYGNHGLWEGEDPAGLDTAGVLWWDPDAQGEDETGEVGKGMYRLVDGGKRYVHGQWPTEPMKLFDPEGTVTVYEDRPDNFKPKSYPSPANK